MSKGSISIALGGGGARGIAHLGVLRFFEEEKIVPSFIAGTSMGAVIGAMYARYRDTVEIEERIANLVKSDFMHKTGLDSYASSNADFQKRGLDYVFNRLRQNIHLARVFTRAGSISADILLEAMEFLIDDIDITELSIPFCAVATDLSNGKPVFFRSGPVRQAITASASIPGVFAPFEYNGMKLVDGAASYLTPVPPAKEFGNTPVIAVDVSKSIENLPFPHRGYGVFFRSGDIAMINYNALLLGQADIVIRPDVAGINWADFYSYPALIEKGNIAARAKLAEIHAILLRDCSFFQRWWGKRGQKTVTSD